MKFARIGSLVCAIVKIQLMFSSFFMKKPDQLLEAVRVRHALPATSYPAIDRAPEHPKTCRASDRSRLRRQALVVSWSDASNARACCSCASRQPFLCATARRCSGPGVCRCMPQRRAVPRRRAVRTVGGCGELPPSSEHVQPPTVAHTLCCYAVSDRQTYDQGQATLSVASPPWL